MERIDLTMENEFTEKISIDVKNPMQNFIRSKEYVGLSYGELESNFALGSIDRIKSSQNQLQMYRSINGNERICECCGTQINIFNETEFTICRDCDVELLNQNNISL